MANDLYTLLSQPARRPDRRHQVNDQGGANASARAGEYGTVTEVVETSDTDRAGALLGNLTL